MGLPFGNDLHFVDFHGFSMSFKLYFDGSSHFTGHPHESEAVARLQGIHWPTLGANMGDTSLLGPRA